MIFFICWFSNGKYLVTASADKSVIVWDVKKKLVIVKMMDIEFVCGVLFDFIGNFLVFINVNGEWVMWNDVVLFKYSSFSAKVSFFEIDFVSVIDEMNASDFVDDEVDGMDEDLDEEDDFVEYDDDDDVKGCC